MSEPLLSLRDLRVWFPVGDGLFRRKRALRAVDGVDLELAAGEALGIVGESGCGKSTIARAILRLLPVTSGKVVWLGRALEAESVAGMRPLRRDMQIVFQDPLASLDPRMTVGEIVAEPLRVHAPQLSRAERRAAVVEILGRVGLPADVVNRYPHEFSGGQCQRIGIARAMVLRPKLLVCDEPVSALDVSIQAQIVNLLQDLKRDFGMSILFVSHNLAVVRRLCDRVIVLYLGKPVELAPTESLYAQPAHPYTRGLLAAVPIPDPDIQPARLGSTLSGELPSPLAPPSGCVFRTRCPHATERCANEVPVMQATGAGRQAACLRLEEIS
ncbi:MAG: ATP-binding cassette domain-containing protein [Gammaproteobacteria bacterium]|nr:ATP-binding cassette domain-containing protein [Gammaproteobacteria bacterium]